MSIFNLKWTKGAPDFLISGMIVRIPSVTPGETEMFLAGTMTPEAARLTVMSLAIEWAQAIEVYQMSWLNDMGIPAKAAV